MERTFVSLRGKVAGEPRPIIKNPIKMFAFLLSLVFVVGAAYTAANFVNLLEKDIKHDIELRAEYPEFAEEGLL